MTEGTSLFIAKGNVLQFSRQEFFFISENNSIDITRLQDKTTTDFKSWGKHFLICLDNFTIKETLSRLRMTFSNSELNRDTSSTKSLDGNINTYYNWSSDVMNENRDLQSAQQKLKKSRSNDLLCIIRSRFFCRSGKYHLKRAIVLYLCFYCIFGWKKPFNCIKGN